MSWDLLQPKGYRWRRPAINVQPKLFPKPAGEVLSGLGVERGDARRWREHVSITRRKKDSFDVIYREVGDWGNDLAQNVRSAAWKRRWRQSRKSWTQWTRGKNEIST